MSGPLLHTQDRAVQLPRAFDALGQGDKESLAIVEEHGRELDAEDSLAGQGPG